METIRLTVPSLIDPYYAQIRYRVKSNVFIVHYPRNVTVHKSLKELILCLRSDIHIEPKEVDKVEDIMLEHILLD